MQQQEHGLGRLVAPDERDAAYPMRAAIERAEPPAEKPTEPFPGDYYWPLWPPLDQGAEPHCVGFAWRHWLSYAPILTAGGPDAATIYCEAQKLDEWPGESYSGTSVRAAAKYLQSLGHIANYYWAQGIEDVADFVRTRGPVVVGTDWYASMSRPLPNGLVAVSGRAVGGHAYLVYGYSTSSRLFRCCNSWGMTWGQGGGFWVTWSDMAQLLARGGEACAAIEKALV